MSDDPNVEPYAPLNIPKKVAEDIWIVDGPEIDFTYLGLKLPFPTRMTVLRLPGDKLFIHSPIKGQSAMFSAIEGLGEVTWLVAPNTLHYWYLPDWARRYPDARVYVAPGLPDKAKRPLPPRTVLSKDAEPDWAGEIDQVVVCGDMLNEVDFFHRPSRTLILTDLIENFEPNKVRAGWFRFLLKVFGAADPDGKAPFDMQVTFWRHKDELRAAVRQMIDWAPERIILAHGRWYEGDAVKELERAFRWVL